MKVIPKIDVQNLYKVFPVKNNKKTTFFALSDVSFDLASGQCLGLIGRNGAGKSTLANILSGQLSPSAGTISINGEVSILAINAGMQLALTGRENIRLKCLMLGMRKQEIADKMADIIAFSELNDFIDQPVKSYSLGMRARLGFSIMVHQNPDILIIDEALAVGDSDFMKKSWAKIYEFRNQAKTIVLVSHSMATIRSWCDKVIWLDEGEIQAVGTADDVIPKYEMFMKSNVKTGNTLQTNPNIPRTSRRQVEIPVKTDNGWFRALGKYIHEQVKYLRIAVNLSNYRTKSMNFQNRLDGSGNFWIRFFSSVCIT